MALLLTEYVNTEGTLNIHQEQKVSEESFWPSKTTKLHIYSFISKQLSIRN